ncbi:hypothetical protein TIFTF001_018295 [Ficus carica]|uniref:Uncharacterized protein n=1 Tax=Ficus carica TaxID=3494 RepID=A0AA88DBI2_FICCA|nr:hypothetical protein TIFTF001_018295 [Ficus carica]
MRKAQANGDSTALKDFELDAKGKFSDLIEFERKKLVEFNWDRILENIGKFGVHSSLKEWNSIVVAIEEIVV